MIILATFSHHFDEKTGLLYLKISIFCCNQLLHSFQDRLKFLGYSRYKFVIFVHTVQHRDQGARIATMSLMDAPYDNFAQYCFSCVGFDVIGVVYAVYTY